jgi:hypothetical protein
MMHDSREGSCFLKLTALWVQMCRQNHDESSQFVYLLTRGSRRFLVPEDFVPLVQDIVDTHPGLGFLKEATEFHSRYVHTVRYDCQLFSADMLMNFNAQTGDSSNLLFRESIVEWSDYHSGTETIQFFARFTTLGRRGRH